MEYRKLSDLHKLPNNPRVIRDKQFKSLCDSIRYNRAYFEARPLILSDRTAELVIIAGNQRYEAAKAIGLAEVPTFLIHGLTVEAEREITIKDNAHLGEWDWDSLANEFSNLPLAEWGVDLPADWTSEPQATADAEPQIDRAAELQEQWQTARGQLWQIGRHRLLCGDSTIAEDVGRLMGGEDADMVVSDPPYGISIVAANESVGGGEAYNIPFGGRKKRLGTVGGPKPFGSRKIRGSVGAANIVDVGKYAPIIGDDTTETAVRTSRMLLDLFPDAKQFWFGANHYAHTLPPSSCWVVWDKEATGNFSDCELAWSNQRKAVRLFRHKWNGMLRDSERERRLHPSQKPAALASWIYREFGNDGDIVLDPFVGAGWTLIAAENTNRKARAIELSQEYIAVILQRMTDAFPGIEIKRLEP